MDYFNCSLSECSNTSFPKHNLLTSERSHNRGILREHITIWMSDCYRPYLGSIAHRVITAIQYTFVLNQAFFERSLLVVHVSLCRYIYYNQRTHAVTT